MCLCGVQSFLPECNQVFQLRCIGVFEKLSNLKDFQNEDFDSIENASPAKDRRV